MNQTNEIYIYFYSSCWGTQLRIDTYIRYRYSDCLDISSRAQWYNLCRGFRTLSVSDSNFFSTFLHVLRNIFRFILISYSSITEFSMRISEFICVHPEAGFNGRAFGSFWNRPCETIAKVWREHFSIFRKTMILFEKAVSSLFLAWTIDSTSEI